jgi:transcription elongation factor SPT5
MNRGGKFLRHAPPNGNSNVFSDSSDDDSDDDEIEEPFPSSNAPDGNTTTNNNATTANLSSSDDDSDDDDEDDNEAARNKANKRSRSRNDNDNVDDDGNRGGLKKKPKKNVASSFFDEEAEDDGDEEEEEPYGTHHDPHDRVKKHYTDDDVRRENMDQEALEIIERQNRRRQRERMLTGETDVAEVARQLEERHRMQSRRVERNIMDDESVVPGDGNPNLSAVSQQSLLPSVSDPRLWIFSCANGKEQELVIQIMNKCIAHARVGKPLGITSAVAAQSKGKLYIESYSEPAIREAVQGVRGIMAYSMRMVPINDMTTVMTVTPKKKPGEFVVIGKDHLISSSIMLFI